MQDLKLKIEIIILALLLLAITFVLIQFLLYKRKADSNSSNTEKVSIDFRGDRPTKFKKSELSAEQRKKIIKVVLLTVVVLIAGLFVLSYLKKHKVR